MNPFCFYRLETVIGDFIYIYRVSEFTCLIARVQMEFVRLSEKSCTAPKIICNCSKILQIHPLYRYYWLLNLFIWTQESKGYSPLDEKSLSQSTCKSDVALAQVRPDYRVSASGSRSRRGRSNISWREWRSATRIQLRFCKLRACKRSAEFPSRSSCRYSMSDTRNRWRRKPPGRWTWEASVQSVWSPVRRYSWLPAEGISEFKRAFARLAATRNFASRPRYSSFPDLEVHISVFGSCLVFINFALRGIASGVLSVSGHLEAQRFLSQCVSKISSKCIGHESMEDWWNFFWEGWKPLNC